jgi:MFS family permease
MTSLVDGHDRITGTRSASRAATTNRRDVAAAIVCNALEFYDFTTYAFFAVMIGKAFFVTDNPWISLLLSVATFGVGFVTRPIGGVFIGAYADRAGRKPAMLLTIILMAVGMIMLAATPSYASIGIAAPILVVLGRLIQGFALGGEVGPSTAFLLESAPASRRGLYTSWQLASQGIAIFAAGLAGVVLSLWLSPDEMQAWGWRVPFFIGLLIIPVGIYIRRNLEETAESDASAGTKAVFTRLFQSQMRSMLLAVPLILCGTVSTYIGNYMTTYAITSLKLPQSLAISATAVVGICVTLFSLVGGWLSDRYGRKMTMLIPRAAILVLAYPAFVLMTKIPSAMTLLSMSALLATLMAISGGASLVAIPELLPRAVRSAGLSISYAFVVTVFGGTTQLVITWLIGVTGDPLSPAYYLILTSVIGVAAMVLMPETAHRKLD